MTVLELITALQEVCKRHGDIEVVSGAFMQDIAEVTVECTGTNKYSGTSQDYVAILE